MITSNVPTLEGEATTMDDWSYVLSRDVLF